MTPTMPPIERRAFAVDQPFDLITRSADDGGQSALPKLRGHAAIFNTLSPKMWGFREQVAPGAFTRAIQEDDVRALWNHNSDMPLGRNRAKPTPTLTLSEDERGLLVEIDPPDTQYARDLVVSMRRGDVTQMSFGFMVISQEWRTDTEDGVDIRTIREVRLFDVSPVTYPAYPETDVEARARQAIAAEGRRALQDPGAWRAEQEILQRRLRLLALGG